MADDPNFPANAEQTTTATVPEKLPVEAPINTQPSYTTDEAGATPAPEPPPAYAKGFTSEQTETPQLTPAVPTSGIGNGYEPNTIISNPVTPLDKLTQARDDGYDWPTIDEHLANFRDRAAQFGYTDREVDDHLGYQDSLATFDHLSQGWQQALADNPELPDKLLQGRSFASGTPTTNTENLSPLMEYGNIAADYATALNNGTAKGPDDFADMEARSVFHALDVSTPAGTYDNTKAAILDHLDTFKQQLALSLPQPQELVDASIAVANQAGLDVTPQNMALIRSNLMDNWADTGMRPGSTLAQAMNNPQLREKLTGQDYYKFPDIWGPIARAAEADEESYASGPSIKSDLASDLKDYNTVANGLYKQFNPNNLPPTTASGLAAATATAALSVFYLGKGSFETIGDMFQNIFAPPIAAGLQLTSELTSRNINPEGAYTPGKSAAAAAPVLNEIQTALMFMAPGLSSSKVLGVRPTTALLSSEALRTIPAGAVDVASRMMATAKDLMQDRFPKGMKPPTMVSFGDETGFASARPHDIAPQAPITYSIATEKTGQTSKIGSVAGQAPTTMPKIDVIEHHRITLTDTEGNTKGFLVDVDGPKATLVNLPKMPIVDLTEAARTFFRANPDIETFEGRARQGTISLDRDTVLNKPAAAMEAMGASPHEVLQATVNDALGQPKDDAAFDAGVRKFSRQAADEGRVFENLVTEAGASKDTIDLARGYDLGATLHGMFRNLLSDESGAGRVARADPNSKAYLDTYAAMDRLLTRLSGNPAREMGRDLIRKNRGVNDQVAQYYINLLMKNYSAINNTFFKSSFGDNYEKAIRAGDVSQDPVHMMSKFIDGTGPLMLDPKHPLTGPAYAMRDIMDDAKAQAFKTKADYKNYLAQEFKYMWAKPKLAEMAFLGKSFTRAPSLSDGIEMGLQPRKEFMDPIGARIAQIQGMFRYKTRQDILAEGKAATVGQLTGSPLIKDFPALSQIPEEYKPLSFTGSYGLAGFADMWNRMYSKGLYSTAETTPYQRWLTFSNTLTALKLLFPTYHAQAMLTEAMMANISTGLGRIAQREYITGLHDVVSGVVAPYGLARLIIKGRELQKNYLAKNMAGDPLATLFAQSGGRIGGRQDVYKYTTGASVLDAFQKGGGLLKNPIGAARAFVGDLTHDLVQTIGSPDESVPYRLSAFLPRLAGFGARETIRITSAALGADFLFDKLIPWLKQGAFGMEMQMHLDKNPMASPESLRAKGRQIIDSMDNRFGELNQNNLFWNNTWKQALNASLVSLGWEYGSLRTFANSIGFGLERGHQLAWNPVATRWLLSFAIGSTITSNFYQYAMTGTTSWNTGDIWDNFVPRNGLKMMTSGVTAPGRTMMPGYMKDAMNFYKLWQARPIHNVLGIPQEAYQEALGKLNPALQMIANLIQDKDYFGNQISTKPIVGPDGKLHKATSTWDSLQNYYQVLKEAGLPIPFASSNDGLSSLQHYAGFRVAGAWLANPQGFAKQQEYFYNKTATQELGSANRAAAKATGGEVTSTKKPTRADRMKAINRMNE